MTPDELKREEEVLRRILQRIITEFNGDTTAYFESVTKRKPTPKTVEAREWPAYVDETGRLWNQREFVHMTQVDAALLGLQPIRVREVIGQPKEPKERFEKDFLIREQSVLEINPMMNIESYKKLGWRLATLVEKGGGE